MSELTDTPAVIVQMLASIESKVDDLNDRQKRMNGTVATLVEWRAAKNAECRNHVERTEAIHKQIKDHRTWIDQAKGAAGASRLIIFALGALCGGLVSLANTLLMFFHK